MGTNNIDKKKVFFLAVTGDDGSDDRAYSNFVYAMCREYILENDNLYDADFFKRHDMLLDVSNIQHSVYKLINESDAYIVLLDLYETSVNPYCANVWFELGRASTQQDKTIVLIVKEKIKDLPFYVAPANCIKIPDRLMEWFNTKKDSFKNNEAVKHTKKSNSIFEGISIDTRNDINNLISRVDSRLSNPSDKNPFARENELASIDALGKTGIIDVFNEIKSKLDDMSRKTNVAEYIPGEKAAFQALIEAVRTAKERLRTTRFANQSIVISQNDNSDEAIEIDSVHKTFMTELKNASRRGVKNTRIICNNNPTKWLDIFDFLTSCSTNKDKTNGEIFIMQKNYSINFELVIIDENIAFLHFYQPQINDNENESEDKTEIERIQSTLKIIDKDVCKELTKVYDRLIYTSKSPDEKISRYILGGKERNSETCCFKAIPRTIFKYDADPKYLVISKFITALNAWKEISDEDKINMLVGACLVAGDAYQTIDMLKMIYKDENGNDLDINESIENEADKMLAEIRSKEDGHNAKQTRTPKNDPRHNNTNG